MIDKREKYMNAGIRRSVDTCGNLRKVCRAGADALERRKPEGNGMITCPDYQIKG